MSDIINIGGITVSKFYLGGSDDVQIFLGTTKLYPNAIKDYLRTVARGSGTITLTIGSAVTTSDMSSIAYSTNGTSWTTLNNVDDTTITASVNVSSGDTVYWKGVGVQTAIAAPSRSGGVPKATIFSSDVNFDVEGNAMSMLFDDNFEGEEFDSGTTYHLSGLFYNNTHLINASGMTLPATTLYDNDYNDMFYGCSGLTSAPSVLPATTIGASTYKRTFSGCTSLIAAPQISATTMNGDQNCESMFYGCSGLTTAPSELPATTLTAYCYRYMFQNCTSLTIAPSLPATTLANYCYYYMFRGCTSLTTAPSLPATTLVDYCYQNMFYGCTSLTTAPSLPATTLANYCYSSMFYECTSLTTAPALPATTLASSCYYTMFQNCSSLTSAPALPATTLASYCYYTMFQGCTSLTTAPYLPATTLVSGCYQYMFYNCSSLNRIECNADTYYSNATSGWVNGVAASGKFIKNSSNTWWTTGNNGIPTNWSVGTLPAERTDWVKAETTDYVCVGYDKHYKEYLEETTDGGITWVYVTPLSSRTSEDVIEYDSTDCGYVPPVANYFKITSLAANNTITLRNNTRISSGSSFSYSTDNGTTWSSFSLSSGQTQTIATLESGDTILMYGTNKTLGSNYNAGHYFRGTADYMVSGEISSLVNGSDVTDTELSGASRYTFAQLFSGDTHLVSAENLLISSTALPDSCFNSTFRSCTNLVKAPTTLPSTILGPECYSSMFESCTSLAYPPAELYFTSVNHNSYNRMFCMSRNSKVTAAMTESPKMFGNWGSVNPATNNMQMFCGNGSLETIYCYWTNTSGTFGNIANWVNYTDDTNVTFYKRSTQSFASGVNGIKTGWTVINDDTTQPS